MASERRSKKRGALEATRTPDGQAPWADLEVTVPTDRNHASVVALLECPLVELTHEGVGAVFVSRQIGGSPRTQYVAGVDTADVDHHLTSLADERIEDVANRLIDYVSA